MVPQCTLHGPLRPLHSNTQFLYGYDYYFINTYKGYMMKHTVNALLCFAYLYPLLGSRTTQPNGQPNPADNPTQWTTQPGTTQPRTTQPSGQPNPADNPTQDNPTQDNPTQRTTQPSRQPNPGQPNPLLYLIGEENYHH